MDIQNIEKDLERTMDKYGSLLFKMCLLMVKNRFDAEDIVQNTLVKYYTANVRFISEDYKKNWLIKVSQNECKDLLRKKRHLWWILGASFWTKVIKDTAYNIRGAA